VQALHQTPGAAARKRGPKPVKVGLVKEQMRRHLEEGLPREELEAMLEKELKEKYGCSRDTARKALKAVLSEFVVKSNFDK
jgi:DNA-binding GntR family transcriptional regulator